MRVLKCFNKLFFLALVFVGSSLYFLNCAEEVLPDDSVEVATAGGEESGSDVSGTEELSGQADVQEGQAEAQGQEAKEDSGVESVDETLVVKIPVLGAFVYKDVPGGEPESGEKVKKAYPAKESFDFGFVHIKDPVLTKKETGEYDFSASVNLFNTPVGKITLKEFVPGEKLFATVELTKPYELSLWQGPKLLVKDAVLEMTEEGITARTQVTIAEKPDDKINLVFNKTEEEMTATCTLPSIALPLLIQPLKGTPLEKIVLTDGAIKIIDPFKNETRKITADGMIDGSGLVGDLRLPVKIGRVGCHAQFEDGIASFEAVLAPGETFNPMAYLPGISSLPGMQDLSFKNLKVFFSSNKELGLAGEVSVFGVSAQAKAFLSGKTFVLRVMVPESVNIFEKIPVLNVPPFSLLEMQKTFLLLTSDTYFDPDLDMKFLKGLSIGTSIALGVGPLAPIKGPLEILQSSLPGFLAVLPERITFVGTIGTSQAMMRFRGALESGMKIGRVAKIKSVMVQITGKPSVSLLGQIEVYPPPQFTDKLLGTAEITAGPQNASIAGTMEGAWNDPLGVKGLSIEDVAITIGINYSIFSQSYTPTKFGMAGKIAVGKVKVEVAGQGSSEGDDTVISGGVNRLFLRDLVELAQNMGDKVVAANAKVKQVTGKQVLPITSSFKIPDLPVVEFEDVTFYLVPQDSMIGELPFYQGFRLTGTMKILNKTASVDINGNSEMIKCWGSVSPIDLGQVFSMTGRGKFGGPELDILITPELMGPPEKLTHFNVTGDINCLGVRAKGHLVFQKDTVSFETQGKIPGLMDISLQGKSVGSGEDLDFVVSGEGHAGTLKLSGDELTGARAHLSKRHDELEQEIAKGPLVKKIDVLQKRVQAQAKKNRQLRDKINGIKRELGQGGLLAHAIGVHRSDIFYSRYTREPKQLFARLKVKKPSFSRPSPSPRSLPAPKLPDLPVAPLATTPPPSLPAPAILPVPPPVSKPQLPSVPTRINIPGRGWVTISPQPAILPVPVPPPLPPVPDVGALKDAPKKAKLLADLTKYESEYRLAQVTLSTLERQLESLKKADPTVFSKVSEKVLVDSALNFLDKAQTAAKLGHVEIDKLTISASLKDPKAKISARIRAFGSLEKNITLDCSPEKAGLAVREAVVAMASEVKTLVK